jgi:metallo-beta-lactamase class B
MKLLITLLLILPAATFSQYRITIILDKVPANTSGDRLYISGNFNNWEPADENTVLTKGTDGRFSRIFDDVQAGQYEYKFTMGSMESIEVAADGKDLSNRILNLSSDTTIHLTVARWKNAKLAYIGNISTWSSLLQPYYSLPARVKKPDGVISRFRQTLPKS